MMNVTTLYKSTLMYAHYWLGSITHNINIPQSDNLLNTTADCKNFTFTTKTVSQIYIKMYNHVCRINLM